MTLDLTRGAAREQIDANDVSTLHASGVLVDDPRRERPRYFDGRFLAARDLTRDQAYFLTREADLGRAAGSGVGDGLHVTADANGQVLTIAAGQGVTPAGELVLLPSDLAVNLTDIPQAEQLSAAFGLSRIPAPTQRNRTGLFILALRPVEFTANPIGAYPTSLTGPRTVEDGDVIEATALVLVPWQDDGAVDSLQARRGRAARAIFLQPTPALASVNVLPVAMLALQSNTIVWLDEAMVRRELGADRGDLPGLGLSPHGLRLAHLLQYQKHLSDLVASAGNQGFPAATQFQALPPAGPLPPGIINTTDFTQRYFPSEVDVDFSVIPDDELPSLVEEALALPPIDFQASEATLDLTAVLVLAPVARADFKAVLAKLATSTRVLKPAAPNLIAQRSPLEILQRLRLPLPIVPVDPANPSDAQWVQLAQMSTLWYVRRRNLAYRQDLAGAALAVAGTNDLAAEAVVRERVATLGLTPAFTRVMAAAGSKAAAGVYGLLAAPRTAASPALTAATLGALATRAGGGAQASLDYAGVLDVAAQMNATGVGDGLARLERSSATGVTKKALEALASNDQWRKLDRTARVAPATSLHQLAARLTRDAVAAAADAAPAVVEADAAPVARPVAKPAKPGKPVVAPKKAPARKAASATTATVSKATKAAKTTRASQSAAHKTSTPASKPAPKPAPKPRAKARQ